MDAKNRLALQLLLLAVCTIPTSTGEWRVMVPKELDALVTSCVVIPCSFTHTHGNLPASRQKAIWYLSSNPNHHVYNEDDEDVRDKFKERTKLLGQLGQNNCTLEIKDIKDHDNGPFCLKIDVFQDDAQNTPTDSHSFVNDCVQFKILPDPPKPRVTPPEAAYEDQLYTLTCSVTHTCPGPFHRPNLTWSRGEEGKVIVMHRELQHGYWEVLSILTLMPSDKDDHSEVTCTAQFNGGRTASTTMTIYLKRKKNNRDIIIPVVVGIGTAAVFGVVCLFILKKYRRRISELQNQDGSVWNRLSRMSTRIRSGPGPSCSHQRTSHKRPKICNKIQKDAKPHFPSPERLRHQQNSFSFTQDPGDDDYINTADLQIYGNL